MYSNIHPLHLNNFKGEIMAVVYVENASTRVVTTKAYSKGAEVGSFIFLPGLNILDSDLYNKLRPSLEKKLKEKKKGFKEHFVESKEPGKDGKVPKVTSTDFKALSPDQAEEIVSQVNNIDALKKLKKGEARDSVRAAIGEQLDNLENFKKKGQKKKTEE